MSGHSQSSLFWGVRSPLATLSGAGLLVIASGRVAFALICSLALVWVYVFTTTAVKLGGKYIPAWGRTAIPLFVSALGAYIFTIFLWIFNPILALESAFFILLTPVVFTASSLYNRMPEVDILDALSQSVTEALILGILILGLSLIREPLGYGSISVPGLGIIRFFQKEPLRFLQTSAGALILLGYGIALYRRLRNKHSHPEEE
ncbi:MAG: hypothetical protein LBG84_03885 [Treponema sp.]|jgi:hypothetical protein|nr:hypothetical protein [Treponema sp.]